MTTTSADYEGWADGYWSDDHQKLYRALEGVAALFNAKVSTGTEPADHLQWLEFGDAASHNDARVGYDGSQMSFQTNSGTESTPIWVNRFRVNMTTGNVILTGTLTLGAALDLAGFAVTNAGTINGVTIAAHASRHQPGGSDAISTGVPGPVASANAEGSATTLARSDHSHEGVHQVNNVDGDITIAASTESGSSLAIDTAGSTVTVKNNTRDKIWLRTSGNITLSSTSLASLGNFSNLQFPLPPTGSSGEYLIEFWAAIEAASIHSTTFTVHVGTTGTTADTSIGKATFGTLGTTAASNGHITLEAYKLNPSSGDRITIGYISTVGSNVLQGTNSEPAILRVTRLTNRENL